MITSRRQRFASTLAGPALVVGITIALAACGGDNNSATPGVPPGISPAGATVAPAAPTPEPAAGDDGPGDAPADAPLAPPAGDVAQGASLAQAKGCMSCHQVDTDVVGPKWGGLWGSQVELEGGATVLADEEYLRRAILDPEAERVAGYFVTMPTVSLSDEEVSAIIAYIASLAG